LTHIAEGRRKKEEGRRKKEEGRRKKENAIKSILRSLLSYFAPIVGKKLRSTKEAFEV
jgi:hypothetical protein